MVTLVRHIGIELVTPRLAFESLQHQLHREPPQQLDMQLVLNLASRMKHSHWQPEAMPLVFDQWGRLVDGRHRCHAIVLHGEPVQVAVSRAQVVNA